MRTGWEKFFDIMDEGVAQVVHATKFSSGIYDGSISLTVYMDGDDENSKLHYIIMVRDKAYSEFPILILLDGQDLEVYYELVKKFEAAQYTDKWPVITGYSLGTIVFQNAVHTHQDFAMREKFEECDIYPYTFFRQPEELNVYHVN